jgi:hypothetical protein
MHQQYQQRAPAGAEQNIARSSVAPPGLICPVIPNRWLAPPANLHQPSGLLARIVPQPVALFLLLVSFVCSVGRLFFY